MNEKKTPQSQRQDDDTNASLLQQLGGLSALDTLVGAFYFNVLNDARLAPFFANFNTDAIRNHQRQFLAAALGGPSRYIGRSLFHAHRSLVQDQGLDHSHFSALVDVLELTIHQLGHSLQLNQKIVARVNALRVDVLGTNFYSK